MAEQLFSTTDLARMFGTTRQTINTWIGEGRFPNHQRVGRSYVVPVSDVIDFVDSKLAEQTSEVEKLKKIRDSLSG